MACSKGVVIKWNHPSPQGEIIHDHQVVTVPLEVTNDLEGVGRWWPNRKEGPSGAVDRHGHGWSSMEERVAAHAKRWSGM